MKHLKNKIKKSFFVLITLALGLAASGHANVLHEVAESGQLLLALDFLKRDGSNDGIDVYDLEELQYLKNSDFELLLKEKDASGKTPIYYFIEKSSQASDLLKLEFYNIPADFKDNDGKNMLHYLASLGWATYIEELACQDGSEAIDREYLTGLNVQDNHGNTPLDEAILADKMHAVIALAEKIGWEKCTGLHTAVRCDSEKYFNLFLYGTYEENGCEMTDLNAKEAAKTVVNTPDCFRMTPLHYAVLKNRVEMMKRLLSVNSVNVDVRLEKEERGETPLYMAVKSGFTDIVRLLLEKGADKDLTCETALHKEKPLWCAVRMCLAGLPYHDIVKLLLKYGADKHISQNGKTLLSFAVEGGDFELVKILFNKGKQDPRKITISYNGDTLFDIALKTAANAQDNSDEHKRIYDFLRSRDKHNNLFERLGCGLRSRGLFKKAYRKKFENRPKKKKKKTKARGPLFRWSWGPGKQVEN